MNIRVNDIEIPSCIFGSNLRLFCLLIMAGFPERILIDLFNHSGHIEQTNIQIILHQLALGLLLETDEDEACSQFRQLLFDEVWSL